MKDMQRVRLFVKDGELLDKGGMFWFRARVLRSLFDGCDFTEGQKIDLELWGDDELTWEEAEEGYMPVVMTNSGAEIWPWHRGVRGAGNEVGGEEFDYWVNAMLVDEDDYLIRDWPVLWLRVSNA